MRQRINFSDRTRQWPPKRLGSNVIDPDLRGATDRYFDCHGRSITELNAGQLPTGFSNQEFRTFSMYYRNDKFYIVDYDATKHPVGDADPLMSSGDSSDEDRPSTSTSAERWIDWQRMRFTHREYPVRDSFATFAGDKSKLIAQRRDQRWVATLLPLSHHAERITTDPSCAGMNGYLPILLGLIVYAHEVRLAPWVLTNLFQEGTWTFSTDGAQGRK
ncbi:MAG: hypothetical protein M1828_002040 [Chrysothrix sp. TS-e1954]|nr:MAG: hypothetical protein M1828_002040 [Chrysothrix sp. TS-e1954]